jgi:DNA-binding transcriptional ArsR family regulator
MPRSSAALSRSAPVFAALGDAQRLRLVARLAEEGPLSITRMADGAPITRQAVTKHLRVLEGAGLARGTRSGREMVWTIEPRALQAAREQLTAISRQWDDALERLRAFVEEDVPSRHGGRAAPERSAVGPTPAVRGSRR